MSSSGAHSRSLWERLRGSCSGETCDECRSQATHTSLVLLVTVLLCLPMLAAQIALKNWAAEHERDPRPDLDPLNRTLPDVLLNYWPRNTVHLVDITLYVLMVGTVVVICVLRHSWVITRRLLIQIGIMYFLRGLVLSLTLLPRTYDGECVSDSSYTVWEFLLDMVNVPKNVNVCHAFIFSGHTALAVLLASVWVIYCSHLVVNLVGVALACVTVFFVSYNRLHYTVDIALAVIIALFILLAYHLLLRIGALETEAEGGSDVKSGGPEAPQQQLLQKRAVPRSHPFIGALLACVLWVDARHLERDMSEEENLL